MESNHAAEPAGTSPSGKSVDSAETLARKLKSKRTVPATAKSEAKALPRTPRLSSPKSAGGNLVCRYCGSDDLAPSFKERRDTRCRACFKKRYGSKHTGQRTAGTNRKAKAAM